MKNNVYYNKMYKTLEEGYLYNKTIQENYKDEFVPIYIHVGKSGGTTLLKQLKGLNIRRGQVHTRKPYMWEGYKWYTTIRDPLSRMVSAFNMLKAGYNGHVGKKEAAIEVSNDDLLNNVIFDYDSKYFENDLLGVFDSANSMLESLTSKNEYKRTVAEYLLNYHHLGMGYNYYFGDGWLDSNYNNCIACKEIEDENWLNYMINNLTNDNDNEIKLDIKYKHLRKNNFVTESVDDLSKTAKLNYYNYHKDKDYEILRKMVFYGLLNETIYENYIDNIFK